MTALSANLSKTRSRAIQSYQASFERAIITVSENAGDALTNESSNVLEYRWYGVVH